MTIGLDRRRFLLGSAAGASLAAHPARVLAQTQPIKIGLMTVKSGPLAAGGIHLEQGLTAFLREKGFKLAGRPVSLVVADTGGNPAGARTKALELVERDKVDMIMGPLAAFELLAIMGYLTEKKVPTLAFAGAEDVTQRKRSPYIVRTSDSSAQCLYPLADYVYRDMGLKRAVTIADDFAFGYEQIGGFQRAFEGLGGRVVKKIWAPLNTPDYTPYIAQIQDCDVLCMGLVGANPLKFVKEFRGNGLKTPLVGGSTVADDTITRSYGDEAVGLVDSIPYSVDQDTPANRRFLAAMRKDYGAAVPIGFYAACLWVNGQIVEAALQKTGGKSDDPDALMKAVRSVTLAETPRGPISFDDYGNIVFEDYVRRVERKNGVLMSRTVKIYKKVSQFWTYEPKQFVAQPVYSRDYPPLKG